MAAAVRTFSSAFFLAVPHTARPHLRSIDQTLVMALQKTLRRPSQSAALQRDKQIHLRFQRRGLTSNTPQQDVFIFH